MRFYIVRHGETVDAQKGLHQHPDAPLSKSGIQQAELISLRCSNLSIDKIISSPFERAKHTAEIINKKLNIHLEFSNLLVENKRPSEVLGRRRDSKQVREIKKLLKENYSNQHYHYSDEENFFDLKKRILNLKQFLENQDLENILIVSHGNAIRMLFCLSLLGDLLTPEVHYKLARNMIIKNVGLTILDFDKKDNKWTLQVWNDEAHLAED